MKTILLLLLAPLFSYGVSLQYNPATREISSPRAPQTVADYLITNGAVLDAYTNKQYTYIPASAFIAANTSPAASGSKTFATSDITVEAWVFDDSTDEYIEWFGLLPWNLGSMDIKYKIFWTSASAATNDVVWRLAGQRYDDLADLTTTLPSFVDVVDTATSATVLHLSPASAAVTLGGDSDFGLPVLLRVARYASDGADTLTGDVNFHGVLIEYTPTQTQPTEW